MLDPDSDPDPDWFMKNTFELEIPSSSKHSKNDECLKPVTVHFWIRIVDE
jgi:hypothetical protein